MKNLLIPAFLVLLIWSCNPSQHVSKSSVHKIALDSTEYEISITDPGFNTWYLLNYSPSKDYGNEYYRSKNQLGVNNWNDYFTHGRYHKAIDCFINYYPSIDYGIEVNRKLYWYFKYSEEKSGIRLLQ